jgi:hypothetical protein
VAPAQGLYLTAVDSGQAQTAEADDADDESG